MRRLLTIAGLFCLAACSDSGLPEKPNLIPPTHDMRCERIPTAALVGETPSTTDNPCDASAKIQAIAYECGLPSDTLAFTKNAFLLNVQKARERCDEFCRDQSRSCEGVFLAPPDCGLKSPPNLALDFGKKTVGCPSRCKGQAFNYCSIYHASFLSTDDRSLFKDQKENCRCRKK